MKIPSNIDELIEKYYDGETTVAEETQIHRFFRQKNIPEQYRAEKAMFDHFAREKASRKPRRIQMSPAIVRWIVVAAVLLGAVWFMGRKIDMISSLPDHEFAFNIFTKEKGKMPRPFIGSYVVIDGITYTDPEKVKEHAMEALSDVRDGKETSKSSEDAGKLIEEQLKMFR